MGDITIDMLERFRKHVSPEVWAQFEARYRIHTSPDDPSCERKDEVRPNAAYVINLDRRSERMEQFTAMYAKAGFPSSWPVPERFKAVDAKKLPIPPQWRQQAGGYGCMRSHVRMLEDVLQRPDYDECFQLMVFEDDAVVGPDFGERLEEFIAAVPSDWDLLLLGFQSMDKPQLVNEEVVRVKKSQRTHCYLVRGRAIKALYEAWAYSGEHIDWQWNQAVIPQYRVYAPKHALLAQEEGVSDIEARYVPRRDWGKTNEMLVKQTERPLYFTHSGKLGDLVYALPTLKHFGEAVLYVHTRPDADGYRLSEEDRNSLFPLLEAQSFVREVVWCPTGLSEGIVETKLNAFRRYVSEGRNLADAHAYMYGLPKVSGKWLDVKPKTLAEVVFSRSARYHNPNFDWRKVSQKYPQAVFLGSEAEWRDLCLVVGKEIPWRKTENLLEAAEIIAGAKLFVGNQSCLAAVAEGVGVRKLVLEVSPEHDNCRFHREGRVHCLDGNCDLPELGCGCGSRKQVKAAA